MKRIAAPMSGDPSSFILKLLVYPALYEVEAQYRCEASCAKNWPAKDSAVSVRYSLLPDLEFIVDPIKSYNFFPLMVVTWIVVPILGRVYMY